MLNQPGEKALVARLTSEHSVTAAEAMAAINVAWMGLASGEGELDVQALEFERVGGSLLVFEGGLAIATLEFEPGALPAQVVTFRPRRLDDEEDDGFLDRFEEELRWLDGNFPRRAA